jgi:hypothetical protein
MRRNRILLGGAVLICFAGGVWVSVRSVDSEVSGSVAPAAGLVKPAPSTVEAAVVPAVPPGAPVLVPPDPPAGKPVAGVVAPEEGGGERAHR